MISAFVDFTFVSASPGIEGPVEPFDGLGGHALVVDGVSEIEPSLNQRA